MDSPTSNPFFFIFNSSKCHATKKLNKTDLAKLPIAVSNTYIYNGIVTKTYQAWAPEQSLGAHFDEDVLAVSVSIANKIPITS